MKKILLLLFILMYSVFVFSQTEVINVGTVANDGTGDKLRNAMIKVNTNFSAVRDSFGNIYREPQTRTLVNDSLDQVRADALPLSDYAWLKSDTLEAAGNIVTWNQLQSYSGGSGGYGTFYSLIGNVDGLGFPNAGDSTFSHTNWPGKHITVIREGQVQQQHIDNTTQDGFKFDNTTGIITFRPVLGAGEQLEIWSTNTIQWEALVAEEGGGEAESTLLTGLRAGWMLDEVAGTSVAEVTGTYTGTTNATVNTPGKFGVAETFLRTSAQYINAGVTVGDMSTDDFSISTWMYIDSHVVANRGILGNYVAGGPFYYLEIDDDNNMAFIINFGGANIGIYPATVIAEDTWYNIIITCDRSGNATFYINNISVGTADISAGVAVALDNNANFRIGSRGGTSTEYFTGTMDDTFLHKKLFSSDERTALQTKTYPWN